MHILYVVISFKVKVEEMEMETPITHDLEGNESTGYNTPPPSLLKEEIPEWITPGSQITSKQLCTDGQ